MCPSALSVLVRLIRLDRPLKLVLSLYFHVELEKKSMLISYSPLGH